MVCKKKSQIYSRVPVDKRYRKTIRAVLSCKSWLATFSRMTLLHQSVIHILIYSIRYFYLHKMPFFGRLFTVEPKYTKAKISLR